MNWKRAPLPVVILLLCVVGILQLRETAGEQAGYLLAGAGLVLAGVWAALEVLSRGKDEQLGGTFQEKVTEAVVKRVIDKGKPKTTDEGEPKAEDDEEPPKSQGLPSS